MSSYIPSNDYFMSFDTGDFMYSKVPYDGTKKVDQSVCGNDNGATGCGDNLCKELCNNMNLSNQYMRLANAHLGKKDQQNDTEKLYKDQYVKLANTFISLCLVSFFIVKINNNSI